MKKIVFFFLFSTHILYAIDSWSGVNYSRNSASQIIDAKNLIDSIQELAVSEILDVGCGSGTVTKILSEAFPQAKITAIDPDESMLQQAHATLSGMDQVQIIKHRAQEFSSNKKFDLFTAFHVMHWISKDEQIPALQNIRAHMKTGATGLLILAPTKKGLPFQQALETEMGKPAYQEKFREFVSTQYFYTADEYRTILENSGFFVEMIGYFYNEKLYENQEVVQNWLKQWLPQYKFLAKEDNSIADSFLQDIISSFVEISGTKEEAKVRWGEYILSAKVRVK